MLFFLIFVPVCLIVPYNSAIITNFLSESSYSGKWDLEAGFAQLLTKELVEAKHEAPLLKKRTWKEDAVDLVKMYPDSLIISGKITEFSYTSSVMGVSPFKYRETQATVEIDLEIVKNGELYTQTCKGEEKKRDLILSILYSDEADTEDMEKGTFGDSVFFSTFPGKATKKALDKCVKEIEKYIN